jgi:hemerythrin-like domain-containing protein
MQPSEVRERVLRDHVALVGMLARVDTLATSVKAGDTWRSADLRRAAAGLLEALQVHMHWEDQYLGPALLAADAWGEERQAALERDHREQREVLGDLIDKLSQPDRPPSLIANDMLAFGSLLRQDMQAEERVLLDPNVLRDDVVGIDVETG